MYSVFIGGFYIMGEMEEDDAKKANENCHYYYCVDFVVPNSPTL